MVLLAFGLALWPWLLAPLELPFSRSADLLRHYLPFKEALQGLFHAGSGLPGWNPYTLGGHPLSADPGYGALYPLGVLFFLFPADVLPAEKLFTFFFVFHILLGFFFTARLLQRMGCSREASYVGGLAFALNLKMVGTWYAGFATMIPAQAWLPGAALAYLELLHSSYWKKRIFWMGGLGLSLAFQILAGDAQLMLYTLFGLVMMGGTLRQLEVEEKDPTPPSSPSFLKRLLLLGGGAGVALALASPLLIPASHLTAASVRAGGVPFPVAMQMSIPPAHLPAFFFPALSGSDKALTWRGPDAFWETSFSPGLIVWLLALLALRRYRADARILPLWLAAWVTLVYSFGGEGPLAPLLYFVAPGFDHFRGPARILPLLALQLAVLAALELDAMFGSRDAGAPKRWEGSVPLRVAAGLGALGCLGTLIYLVVQAPAITADLQTRVRALIDTTGAGERAFDGLTWNFARGALLLLALERVCASPALRVHVTRAKALVLMLVALELSATAQAHLETAPRASLFPPHPLAQALDTSAKSSSQPSGRVLDLSGSLPDAIAVQYGLSLVNGMNPLVLTRPYTWLRYIAGESPEVPSDRPVYGMLITEVKRPTLLELLRVQTVVAERPLELPGFRVEAPISGVQVFQQFRGLATYPKLYRMERTVPLPAAWVVARAAAAVSPPDAQTRLDWLERLDLFQSVLVEPPESGGSSNITLEALEALPLRTSDTASQQQAAANVKIVRWEADAVELVATAPPGGGWLVLSEVSAPGWKVWVEGQPAPVWTANHLQRAVWLQEGVKRVRWEYSRW